MSITETQYFMGRDILYPCPDEVRGNARELLERVNALIAHLQVSAPHVDWETKNGSLVSSGWRPPQVNAATPGAAPKSKHMIGKAVDIYDPDGDIDNEIDDELLDAFNLWREHPAATKGWVHLQSVPPKSGKRTFYP